MDQFTQWARHLQAIAQTGLEYGKDKFDLQRYQEVRQIALEMMAAKTGLPTKKLASLFCGDEGYQTPKLDTRAAIFSQQKILLVHEIMSDSWSLPGGWCDYNLSTVENCVKEAYEESGHHVKAVKLIAIQDRNKHNHPVIATEVTKVFYLCEDLGGKFKANIETDQAKFFAENDLPANLSVGRNTREQIQLCFSCLRDPNWQSRFE